MQGELQGHFLRERMGRILTRAEQTQTVPLLKERAEKFGQVLSEASPHWLAEAQALALAGGSELWQVLALNCLPADFWGVESEFYVPAPLVPKDIARAKADTRGEELVNPIEAQSLDLAAGGGDCTTFFALGGATLSGETLLHKSRDQYDEVQSAYIKHCEPHYRFVGGGDIGNLGTAHLHTEHFWAGANNTGSPLKPGIYR